MERRNFFKAGIMGLGAMAIAKKAGRLNTIRKNPTKNGPLSTVHGAVQVVMPESGFPREWAVSQMYSMYVKILT